MLGVILALSLLVSDMTVALGNLNVNQVYQLLLNNGASQTEAATLAGISVWEAGGGNPNQINPNAINNNAATQDYSVGLFQYNFRAGQFNPSNPMASTRGGYTPGDLLQSLNAQAQSALSLLRGSVSGYRNWTTYTAHFSSIQGFISQLLGTSEAQPGGTTDTQPPVGETTTPAQPTTAPSQTTTGGQASAGGVPPTTGMNLSFAGSIQHVLFQFLLVIVGIALLLGGIYLLGSHK